MLSKEENSPEPVESSVFLTEKLFSRLRELNSVKHPTSNEVLEMIHLESYLDCLVSAQENETNEG